MSCPDESQLSAQDDGIISESENSVSSGHSENMAILRDGMESKNDSILAVNVVLEGIEKMNQESSKVDVGESQESSSFLSGVNYSRKNSRAYSSMAGSRPQESLL